MTTPFGPQLIGETEKTLNASAAPTPASRRCGRWTHRAAVGHLAASQTCSTAPSTTTDCATAVADRAHFPDAAQHVDDLTERGLLDDGRLTSEGRELLARLQASIADDVSAIFDDLAPDDVATTERVLNELLSRARVALAT